MIRKGRPKAKADDLSGFVDHESEHEDRRGSDTLVVRPALNDSAPRAEGPRLPLGPLPRDSSLNGVKAMRPCLEGEV